MPALPKIFQSDARCRPPTEKNVVDVPESVSVPHDTRHVPAVCSTESDRAARESPRGRGPTASADAIRRDGGGDGAAEAAGAAAAVLHRSFCVDVFFQPQLVRHAALILEQRRQGKTFRAITAELGMTDYHMENAARIVKLMEEQRLTDPCIRLTDKLAKVCFH